MNDATVVLDVDGGGNAGYEVSEVWSAAYGLKVLGVGEFAGDGNLVDGVAAFQQRYAGVVALAVALDVEVLGLEERADAGDRFAVYENRADDGLFGVVVIGLKTVGNQALPPGWPTMFNSAIQSGSPARAGQAWSALILFFFGFRFFFDSRFRLYEFRAIFFGLFRGNQRLGVLFGGHAGGIDQHRYVRFDFGVELDGQVVRAEITDGFIEFNGTAVYFLFGKFGEAARR